MKLSKNFIAPKHAGCVISAIAVLVRKGRYHDLGGLDE